MATLGDHHLDALAQSRGFPNYATWAAYQAKQSQALHAPPPPTNWLQSIKNAVRYLPPFSAVAAATDRFNKATGQ